MTASIIFLGTGGDSYVIGKQLRSAGGIIIRINDNQFHLNPGPGALVLARKAGITIRATTAILIANDYLLNCNDINILIDAMTYAGFDKFGVVVGNKRALVGTDQKQPYLLPEVKDYLERTIVLEPGKRVGINDVEIQALKTRNPDPDAIGFKFFTDQFTLSYVGDTKYSRDLIDQYKNSNILVLNLKAPDKEDASGSLSKEDCITIIKEVNPRLAIITGFGIKALEADPLYLAREIQKATNIQTIAAKDGMVINPISYSVDKGQQSLYSFPKKPVKIEEPKINEIREE